ncbi:GPW/gp25 family protein [Bartonella sp. HY038]|uniref:GPW/gp25 family protein n=1 Tax=Bartonella sp. HY038 TaxID=2759660 RepID=UPI0015FA99CE|nr:GPW/gp25 family protein [Bartonella sp. HY038]
MVGLGFGRNRIETLDGFDHVRQSLAILFSTPLNSRVMRRDFGCELQDLIDRPLSDQIILAAYSAIVTACALWEPRYQISNCSITNSNEAGQVAILLKGDYYPRGHLGDFSIVHKNMPVDIPFGIIR